jgi:NADH dehydrogenase/NADH:ubiquinone oxidoreductase subunit G
MKVFIDGKEIDAEPGSTILEAAQSAGIHIPTLCYHKQLSPYGGCRVCIVEVEGIPRLVASCTTPLTEAMVIRTDSEQIRKNRKTVIELILSNHPNECMVCEQSGRCELQDLAYEFGLTDVRFKGEKSVHEVENVNPLLERDYNKCILCGRCVRMCDEVQGVGAVDFSKRGFKAKIATAYDGVLDCEFCGNCITACPVGALTGKPSRFKGRPWETKKVKTVCNYCGCGCSLILHAKDGKIMRVTSVEDECVNEGLTCVKGKFGFEYINHEDRLKTPLIKKNGTFVEASWDEALDTVAEHFKRIKDENGGDSIGGLCSAKCTNEDNYLFQKFMRTVIGTNNIDHCARY